MQRGPDRNLVLESRGLLEGLVGGVSAKCGRQNSCNSFVVLNVAYVLFTSRLGVGMRWCISRPTPLRPYHEQKNGPLGSIYKDVLF